MTEKLPFIWVAGNATNTRRQYCFRVRTHPNEYQNYIFATYNDAYRAYGEFADKGNDISDIYCRLVNTSYSEWTMTSVD